MAVGEVACTREGERKVSFITSGLRAVGKGGPQDAEGTRFQAPDINICCTL